MSEEKVDLNRLSINDDSDALSSDFDEDDKGSISLRHNSQAFIDQNANCDEICALVTSKSFVQYVKKGNEFNQFDCQVSYKSSKFILKFSGKDKAGEEAIDAFQIKDIVKGINKTIFELPKSHANADPNRFVSIVTVDGVSFNLEAETSREATLLVNACCNILANIQTVVQLDKDKNNRWLVVENSGVQHTVYNNMAVAGILVKEGGGFLTSWKTRLFILNDGKLNYYECQPAEKDPLKLQGSIPVVRNAVNFALIPESEHQRPYCFGIKPMDGNRQYVLQADSEEARAWWLKILRELYLTGDNKNDLDGDPAIIKKYPSTIGITKSGYLQKLGGGGLGGFKWQRRYVQQKQGIIKYYQSAILNGVETFKEAGILPIVGGKVERDVTAIAAKYGVEVKSKNYFSITPEGSSKVFMFESVSPAEADDWFTSLSKYSMSKPIGIFHKVGYLQKRGDQFNSDFKERYFILSGDKMAYYKKFKDRDAQGEIVLTASSKVEAGAKDDEFKVVASDIHSRVYVLRAADKQLRDDWIAAVQKTVAQLSGASASQESRGSQSVSVSHSEAQSGGGGRGSTSVSASPPSSSADAAVVEVLDASGGPRETV